MLSSAIDAGCFQMRASLHSYSVNAKLSAKCHRRQVKRQNEHETRNKRNTDTDSADTTAIETQWKVINFINGFAIGNRSISEHLSLASPVHLWYVLLLSANSLCANASKPITHLFCISNFTGKTRASLPLPFSHFVLCVSRFCSSVSRSKRWALVDDRR